MIEVEEKEEPVIVTSSTTKIGMIWTVDVEVLKRAFNIDYSFTKNPQKLEQLASFLNHLMPGSRAMLDYFIRIGKPVTLIYDPDATYSMYKYGHKSVYGNVIVLNSLNLDDILEEFFHVFWAYCISSNGRVPESLRLNAELDAKFYTSFVLSAQVEGSLGGPFMQYKNVSNLFIYLFIEHSLKDTEIYHKPEGKKITYGMTDELYKKFYDAFAIDVKGTRYSNFAGYRGYTSGIYVIFDLLNNRFYY